MADVWIETLCGLDKWTINLFNELTHALESYFNVYCKCQWLTIDF